MAVPVAMEVQEVQEGWLGVLLVVEGWLEALVVSREAVASMATVATVAGERAWVGVGERVWRAWARAEARGGVGTVVAMAEAVAALGMGVVESGNSIGLPGTCQQM